MPLYNEMFKLSVNDMDLIETALRRTPHALSQEQLVQSDEGKGTMWKPYAKFGNCWDGCTTRKFFTAPKTAFTSEGSHHPHPFPH